MFTMTKAPDGSIKLAGKMHDAYFKYAEDYLQDITETTTLDFSDLIYISSSGLGLLLRTQKRLETTGQALVLTGMSGHVRELFAITRFDTIFDIK